MAGWIACAILGIAHAWVGFTIEVVEHDTLAAVREADRDELTSLLREDFGAACRLVPDALGKGFAIERPSEASIAGRAEPDFIVYDCEERQEGPVLVRTVFPGTGGPPSVRRISSGAEACRAALEGRSWRVEVTWPAMAGARAEVLTVWIGARVRRKE
ncbi:MAG: hypothetical protein AAB434_02740 [Planctomycetota bacterium]